MRGDRDWRPQGVRRGGIAKQRREERARVRAEAKRQHIHDHDGDGELWPNDERARADYEDKAAHPWRGNDRAAYALRLGPQPTVPPNSREMAAARAREIEQILERGHELAEGSEGMMTLWSKSERARLRKMANKWWARSRGESAYFNVAGNVGRATEWQWAEIKRERERVKLIKEIQALGWRL